MSLSLRILDTALRLAVRPRLARVGSPVSARREIAWMARLFLGRPRGVSIRQERGQGGGPAITRVIPPDAAPGMVLYFHGGGYVAGSPQTHAALLAALARATGREIRAPRYRLAPEHPFPAAWEDARAAWEGLRAQGCAPGSIALAGDSAGGGLALSLLADLCAEGTPPAAAAVFSPWTDLTGSGPSLRDNAGRDAFLPPARFGELVGYVLGGHDPADPRVSPLFARYPGCPPVFMAVSQAEILRDDALRLGRRLEAEGVPVSLDLQPACPHAWPIFAGRLAEADATIRRAAAFLRAHLGRAAAQRPACRLSR